MHNMKRLLTIFLSITVAVVSSFAQSQPKDPRQWTELQNSIIMELNRSYVDSLPVDRVMRARVDAMLAELDPYTIYVPEEENEDMLMLMSKTYGGIGAIITKRKEDNVIISEPYANSPAQKYGLVCGDEILAIDGVSTIGLESSECSERMKGKPGSKVVFTVRKLRTGDTLDIPVIRERIHFPDVEYAGMLNDSTGYILQTGFTENVSGELRSRFLDLKSQGMKRLVLDLRGNGGGLRDEAVRVASLFVPKGSLVMTQKGNSPETFREFRTVTEPVDTEIPIIVMINSGTASSSEIVAGALQDMDRATIMGNRSFGKGLVQSVLPMPYNGQLKVTTAKYYTPSGRCVQAIDYSHRNEDGSVGHIPDSLTREFRTASGRIVRDGGGIMPDVEIPADDYSRIVYSLVLSGIIDQYALDFVRRNESIPEVDDFYFKDADFEDFISFAKGQEFDYRSSARTLFDGLKRELEKDGLSEFMQGEIDAVDKALEVDKETVLRFNKEQIIPFIEEEISVRYWYQEAGIKVRLRYDEQLKKALTADLIG